MFQLMLHEVHVGSYVLKEIPIAGAEVVQSGFAVGRFGEAVARALAVTGKQVGAVAALGGKLLQLAGAKLFLSVAVHHFEQGLMVDVAQLVFRKYKVVATVDVAVKFHDGSMAACFGQGANSGCDVHPIGQSGVE